MLTLAELYATRETCRAEGSPVPPEVTRAIEAAEAALREEQQRAAGLKREGAG